MIMLDNQYLFFNQKVYIYCLIDFELQIKSTYLSNYKINMSTMHNQGEKTMSLNLTEHYVKEWTVKEALRELTANFMDASFTRYPNAKNFKFSEDQHFIRFNPKYPNNDQIIPTNYIQYDKTNKILIMRNEGSFKPQRMLMGASSRKDNPVATGQFGEGMKLSIIILLRNGHGVTYQSGDYIYYTTLKQWELPYDEGKVLYIQYKPREVELSQRDTTEVKIKNFDMALFEEFRYVSLALMKPFSYECIKKGDFELIIPKDLKVCGQIRNNGLYVRCYHSGTDKNFEHYTYNMKMKLNRERSSQVDVENVKKQQSQLHYLILIDHAQLKQDRPSLEDSLDRHFEIIYDYLTKNKFQTWYFHYFSKNNKALCDRFYQKFLRMMNKEELYPVHSAHQMINITNTIKTYGLSEGFYPYITVSWQLHSTLVHSNKYKSIATKIQQLLDGTQEEEMTQEERVILNNLIGLFKPLFPVIDQYQFKKKNVVNVACYKKPGNEKVIFFNTFELVNNKDKFRDALCVILRA